jgi:hypothetical protein
MTKKRWGDLDPRLRQAFLIGGAFETGLKIATLIDLAQRPRSAVRGSKSCGHSHSPGELGWDFAGHLSVVRARRMKCMSLVRATHSTIPLTVGRHPVR